MRYSDAHIHCGIYESWEPFENSPVCSAAHWVEDWEKLCQIKKKHDSYVYTSFGIHPQNPDTSLIAYLENILQTQHLDAIGETGFDLFTEDYKNSVRAQEEVWHAQLELAYQYNKPVIVHCRKALEKIFSSVPLLKKLKAVVFHSFANSPQEAISLRNKGINAYFSFGKPILSNHKNALRSAASLPLEWILLETDGPYQTLKGEDKTNPSDIKKVYEMLAALRSIPIEDLEMVNANFMTVFADARG